MKAVWRHYPTVIVFGVIALLIILFPRSGYGAANEDSRQLTQLLADADNEAHELAFDADEMQALILTDNNWLTHALMLSKVKGHVDNMALIAEKLSKAQKSGSALQAQAVEQILPLVKELSDNTTASMKYLNQNKNRPNSATYKQYLEQNAETARQLSSMISALLDYERSMTEIQRLRSKLTTAGS